MFVEKLLGIFSDTFLFKFLIIYFANKTKKLEEIRKSFKRTKVIMKINLCSGSSQRKQKKCSKVS